MCGETAQVLGEDSVSSASSRASSLELSFTVPLRGKPKCSLPMSCIRDRFPALGLQVRLNQPLTQEHRLCCRLAGDTDVDVIEVAVGTWVACGSFDQDLTCHLTVDALVLAVKKTASSITNVS